ncbi:MAG: hypothetical protein TUN42_09065 [Dehalogenimonas sp.]
MRKSKAYALAAVSGLIMVIGAILYLMNGPNGPDQIASTFGRSISVFLIGCVTLERSMVAAKKEAAREELQRLKTLKAQIDDMCTMIRTDVDEKK